jgi:hypothetical protein
MYHLLTDRDYIQQARGISILMIRCHAKDQSMGVTLQLGSCSYLFQLDTYPWRVIRLPHIFLCKIEIIRYQ